MFAKMKTRTKVLAGFGFAIAVAVIVGLVGYRGISKLSSHVDDVGLVRLPGVGALNAIQAGQLNVGYGIRGLLIPRYNDPRTRSQQYELIANGFKEAEDALAKYEPLAKTSEEAIAWKEFHGDWTAWKTSLDALQNFCRQKDQLLAGGAKLDDPKVVALDNNTFETAKETRALMLKTLGKVQQLVGLSTDLANNRISQAASDATSGITVMFGAIGLGVVFISLLGVFIAMNISKMLAATIGEARRLSKDAIDGKLLTRGNPELLSREFRPILTGFNETLDRLVGIIDHVPAPVMLIDREFDIQYMNDFGAKVIGLGRQQIIGTKCHQHFKTPHCNTGDCAAPGPSCRTLPWRRRRSQGQAAKNWRSPTSACR